jgi:penicillin amidase
MASSDGINNIFENGVTPIESFNSWKDKIYYQDVNIYGYMSFSFAMAQKSDLNDRHPQVWGKYLKRF